MSLFPRAFANDFASFRPMFQLMDDYASHVLTSGRNGGIGQLGSSLQSFTPRFDIKENKETNSYELHGELPGVQQKDLNIEFTDPNTISIKGRTETVREEGERPIRSIENGEEQNRIVDGQASSQSHQATVEDEAVANTGEKESTITTQQPEQQPAQKNNTHYWLSERSVGSFSRRFSFPERVDTDKVKASLKDGILSIIVPKAPIPASRHIQIE
jgi:HSP20 family molecular chaperone IbpA